MRGGAGVARGPTEESVRDPCTALLQGMKSCRPSPPDPGEPPHPPSWRRV